MIGTPSRPPSATAPPRVHGSGITSMYQPGAVALSPKHQSNSLKADYSTPITFSSPPQLQQVPNSSHTQYVYSRNPADFIEASLDKSECSLEGVLDEESLLNVAATALTSTDPKQVQATIAAMSQLEAVGKHAKQYQLQAATLAKQVNELQKELLKERRKTSPVRWIEDNALCKVVNELQSELRTASNKSPFVSYPSNSTSSESVYSDEFDRECDSIIRGIERKLASPDRECRRERGKPEVWDAKNSKVARGKSRDLSKRIAHLEQLIGMESQRKSSLKQENKAIRSLMEEQREQHTSSMRPLLQEKQNYVTEQRAKCDASLHPMREELERAKTAKDNLLLQTNDAQLKLFTLHRTIQESKVTLNASTKKYNSAVDTLRALRASIVDLDKRCARAVDDGHTEGERKRLMIVSNAKHLQEERAECCERLKIELTRVRSSRQEAQMTLDRLTERRSELNKLFEEQVMQHASLKVEELRAQISEYDARLAAGPPPPPPPPPMLPNYGPNAARPVPGGQINGIAGRSASQGQPTQIIAGFGASHQIPETRNPPPSTFYEGRLPYGEFPNGNSRLSQEKSTSRSASSNGAVHFTPLNPTDGPPRHFAQIEAELAPVLRGAGRLVSLAASMEGVKEEMGFTRAGMAIGRESEDSLGAWLTA